MILPKKTNKAPVTGPKEMKIYELSDKELGIILLRKLVNYKKTQTTKQNWKTVQEQHKKSGKERTTTTTTATTTTTNKNNSSNSRVEKFNN